MKGIARRLLLLGALCFNAALVNAEEGIRPPPSPQPIPYKIDATPIEEQGMRATAVLFLLLLATGLGLYALRKRVPRLAGIAPGGNRLRIIERTRLNPRCTLYLVQYDSRELLLAQCGDHLVRLDPQATPFPNAGTPETTDA